MMQDPEASEAFERAWVATAYSCGRRGAQLTEGLNAERPGALRLARALSREERGARAHVLAAELGRIIAALMGRRLW
jgi:hypothetical protein